jgi:ribonucleoside-diphosphate reductase alpha chain
MCRSFGLPLVRVHRGLVAATGNMSYKVLVSNEMQEMISCIESHKNGPAHHATYQVLVHQEVVEETRLPASHPFYGALRSIKQRQPQNCDNRTAMRLGWNDSVPVYRVTTVEDAGVIPLYDIEVEDAHEYTVNGVVSHNTINLPNSATRDDVQQAYMQAWNSGCLGITIFRDGSKGEQVLNIGVKDEKKAEEATVTRAALAVSHRYPGGIKDRPEIVHGYTRQVRAPEGKVNITLNSDDDGLLEIFVNVGKAGSDIAALAEAVGRLASLNLRLDSPLSQNERAREIARQLKSIGGSASVGFGIQRVRSLPDAVARTIDQHFASDLGEQGGVGQETLSNGAGGYTNSNGVGGNGAPGLNPMMMAQYAVSGNLCSHCGNNTMIYEEGCKKCASCGHSEC